MPKAGRAALALVVALGVLAVMAWFDTTVVREALARGRPTFEMGQYTLLWSLGSFATAAAVVLLVALAWRSRSAAVGAIYLVVGGLFAFLPWILVSFASSHNGVPALLPDPLAIAVASLHEATIGQLNAVGVIGAGMALAGVAVLVRSFRERPDPPVLR